MDHLKYVKTVVCHLGHIYIRFYFCDQQPILMSTVKGKCKEG